MAVRMGKQNKKLTKEEVKHTARLASLPFTDEQVEALRQSLLTTIDYISQIQSLDTEKEKATSQVTGLENVFRKDLVEERRMLTQEEALSNAKKKHKGFFVVKAVFES